MKVSIVDEDNIEIISLYTREVDFNFTNRFREAKKMVDVNNTKVPDINENRSINYEFLDVVPNYGTSDIHVRKSIIYVNHNQFRPSRNDIRTMINEYLEEEVFAGLLNFINEERDNSIISIYDDRNDRYFNIFYDCEYIEDFSVFMNWWNKNNDNNIPKLDVDVDRLHRLYCNSAKNVNVYVYTYKGKNYFSHFEESKYCGYYED